MFCDELKIKVKAGKGGDGCMSFRREKFVPRGGPDGGDGGKGGGVVVKVNRNLNTLGHIKHKKIFKADNGNPGLGKKMHGANAEDMIIEVPPGTMVFNSNKTQKLADLSRAGESITVVEGGIGGMGNSRFATSTNQAPKFAESGEPGEETEIILELKLVADVGLIGLPSAGKSTLISVISNARPKIAAYHFTTLTPNLGVVNMSSFGGSNEDSFVVADIPGLIEGASQGKGLGHQFLKHISRTKLLVHIMDGSEENLLKNYKTIRKEIKEFDPTLTKKPEILVINKEDLMSPKEIKEKAKTLKIKPFVISGITREGLKPLLFEISKSLEMLRKAPKEDIPEEAPVILRPHLDKEKFDITEITKHEGHKVFHITGKRINQLLIMTDTKNLQGLERVYTYLERLGIQKAVERKGATFGDIIKIGEKFVPYRK